MVVEGQDFVAGIGELFGLDFSVFKDPADDGANRADGPAPLAAGPANRAPGRSGA